MYMKKIYYFIILIISLVVIFPTKIMALDINSDYYKFDNIHHKINFKNIDASLVFSTNSNNNRVYITGYFNNSNYLDDIIYTKTLFLDSNKEIIAVCDAQDSLLGEGYSSVAFYCGVDTNDFKNNKTLNDIVYYKVLISVNNPITSDEENNYNSNTNNYIEKSNITSSNKEYYINSYNIKINVNENNTLEITERIGAYFNIPKHGIFRKIPLKNNIVRLDNTTAKNRAKISDIRVNEEYSLYKENGYQVIKIGNANTTLTGENYYLISYLYNLGRDKGKGYDELYFNLIGNEWDTSISNITFTITMPKEFDASKIGFSSGEKGSIDSSKVTYSINGNTITGKFNGTLNSFEALTIRLELPEGYFVNTSLNIDLKEILAFVIPILFTLITFGLWLKFGKDDQVIETVEFYPPEGFNSAEVAFLYKGKIENKDATSLLIYLANKGYIKIEETNNRSIFSTTKSFKIIKLKDYDGNSHEEEIFLKGLFLGGTKEVTTMDLYDHFYITLDRIKASLNKKENKEKIFEKTPSIIRTLIILMLISTFLIITIIPMLQSEYGFLIIPFVISFTGIGLGAIIAAWLKKGDMSLKIFATIWGLFFAGYAFVTFVLPVLVENNTYLLSYIIGIICIFIMAKFLYEMPKRTKYGTEILGKIKGFKNFLETAEKDRLESLVMSNPTYFYDILPFTYVLGVSDKWINKFETIALQAPSWYGGYSSFDSASFGHFITETMSSTTKAMSSSPSSDMGGSSGGSSGGGSSGGGSSGGGSGGGGGGSW